MINYIRKAIFNWYRQNKRDLPWRDDKTAYKVWLSEIILQQTRVSQGLPYYKRFIEQFPTIKDLAEAEEQVILRMWQGLGYYTRARNLHQAARQILHKYNGNFPGNAAELKKLKGVGEYTSAAIASMVYNEGIPVVDGNVYRVLSRLFDEKTAVNTPEGNKRFRVLAADLLDPNEPGLFNEAIMEFGALQCTVSPHCDHCPLAEVCIANTQGTVKERPVKTPARKKIKRYLHYFLIQNNGSLMLTKRTGDDIWKHMYQLPLMESELDNKTSMHDFLNNFNIKADEIHYLCRKEHILTHRVLVTRFYKVEISGKLKKKPDDWLWVKSTDIDEYPVPRLIENFFRDINTQ